MRKAQLWTITNTTNDTLICAGACKTDTWWSRVRGLLGSPGLSEEAGLLIGPSSGVHTFGMSFPIDVVTLDRDLRVLAVWADVGPGKVRGISLRTRSVLELRSGRAHACSIRPGDQLLATLVSSQKAT